MKYVEASLFIVLAAVVCSDCNSISNKSKVIDNELVAGRCPRSNTTLRLLKFNESQREYCMMDLYVSADAYREFNKKRNITL